MSKFVKALLVLFVAAFLVTAPVAPTHACPGDPGTCPCPGC